MNFYQDNGYVEAHLWFDDPAPIVFAIGGRGIGKTFNALDVLTGEMPETKYIYMRRTQSQIDACKLPELNPFKSINKKKGRDYVMSAMGKYVAGIYHGVVEDGALKATGAPVGIGIALSVFSNIRGVDGLDYDLLLFDEFIKEHHERPIQAEGEAFLNAYETLNRNRELEGIKPLKAILLSNSNDLASPILDSFGLIDLVDKMQRKGRNYATAAHGMIAVYLYHDSPISKRKEATALYKATSNKDFSAMSLENSFSAANYEYVRALPLQEFKPLVSIGNCTVYQHASNNTFYVIDGVKSDNRYTTLPLEQKGFRRRYWFLYEAMLDKRLFYSNAAVKIRFERVWL